MSVESIGGDSSGSGGEGGWGFNLNNPTDLRVLFP
jgi:hypothetical protein